MMNPAEPLAAFGTPYLDSQKTLNGQIAIAVCPFLNKMNKICNIKYIDAYCVYTKNYFL